MPPLWDPLFGYESRMKKKRPEAREPSQLGNVTPTPEITLAKCGVCGLPTRQQVIPGTYVFHAECVNA
jgi:hypothetical protein